MPNWCSNTLSIRGELAERQRFIDAVRKTDKKEKTEQSYDIFGQLYPIPVELKETTSGFFGDTEKQKELEEQQARNREKYGYGDWYDWCVANWGTKWGDCNTYLDESNAYETTFCFDSAWSPPIEGLTFISKSFPSLIFTLSYIEEGMGFYGVAQIVDGDCDDICENVEDIEGYGELVFEDDEADWDKAHDMVTDAVGELINKKMKQSA